MANEIKRGFVQRIDVGRAGLVVATLLHEDGTTTDYQIQDLDADPERFNERLSKLGLLRDAMMRAEPVEIESSRDGDGPWQIERVVRLSRDSTALPRATQSLIGIVLNVFVLAENRPLAAGERADLAQVDIVDQNLQPHTLRLDLQIPERTTAAQQLALITAARERGEPLRFIVDTASAVIAGVGNDGFAGTGGEGSDAIDGFVESIALAGIAGVSNVASIGFITAPPFVGEGNIVGLTPFAPEPLNLLVLRGSEQYKLFEAGLRDGLRMRVQAVRIKPQEPRSGGDAVGGGKPGTTTPSVVRAAITHVEVKPGAETPQKQPAFAAGVTLLAPLASASRPVWIRISRMSLDRGPDGFECTPGVPSSDLTPASLRDLKLPYPAEWIGQGCFNHGVYRFQLKLQTEFELLVDGCALCLHDADSAGVKFAYACLDGDHEVRVKLCGWTCDMQFAMDVYRIR
ncbi:MAG: hypothetical protein IT531_16195 [Burkholderiales bacterium]|nr:hypothetical protein [Burkholderiales bacterium]